MSKARRNTTRRATSTSTVTKATRKFGKRSDPNAQKAVNAADFESTYLTARAKGIPVKQIDTPTLSIKAAAHGWLEDVKLSNRPETYELYEHTVRQFQEWNSNGGPHRVNVVDLTRRDLLEYRKRREVPNSSWLSFSRAGQPGSNLLLEGTGSI